jgi:hypothetical protein
MISKRLCLFNSPGSIRRVWQQSILWILIYIIYILIITNIQRRFGCIIVFFLIYKDNRVGVNLIKNLLIFFIDSKAIGIYLQYNRLNSIGI